MSSYVIISDSTLDLNHEYCEKAEIEVIPMKFTLDGKEYNHYTDAREMGYSEFYNHLRNGKISTTSQINYSKYYDTFYNILIQGKDIIYIAFSSALSGSYNTSLIAVSDLKQKFPTRKITAIDSKSASVGEGLLVYIASLKAKKGYSYEKLCEWVIKYRDNICHWFVVDDLEHLRKGGRITDFSANVGKLLQIKPLLTVDNVGALKTFGKTRGLIKSLEILVDKVINECIDLPNAILTIGHADSYDNAVLLKNMIVKKAQVKKIIISDIGPVIGTHVGSGMIAVTFIGKERCK